MRHLSIILFGFVCATSVVLGASSRFDLLRDDKPESSWSIIGQNVASSNNQGPKYDIDMNSIPKSLDWPTSSSKQQNDINIDLDSTNEREKNDRERELDEKKQWSDDNDETESVKVNKDDDESSVPVVHVRRIYIVPQSPFSSWFTRPLASRPLLGADNEDSVSTSESGTRMRSRPSLYDELFGQRSIHRLMGFPLSHGDEDLMSSSSSTTQGGREKVDKTSDSNDEKNQNDKDSDTTDRFVRKFVNDAVELSINGFFNDIIRKMIDPLRPMITNKDKNETDLSTSPTTMIGGTKNGTSLKGNETQEVKEEIVDIDGVKYLHKTIITKNIGQNHMFVSKRFVLTPLNETTTANATTPTPTPIPTTNTPKPQSTLQPEASESSPTTTQTPSSVTKQEQTTTAAPSSSTTATTEAPETITNNKKNELSNNIRPQLEREREQLRREASSRLTEPSTFV